MAPSPSSAFSLDRQDKARTYAASLSDFPETVITETRSKKKKDPLRIFDSSLPYNRQRMKDSLIERITKELGNKLLEGKEVKVETVYEVAPLTNPRKLLSITISIVDKSSRQLTPSP